MKPSFITRKDLHTLIWSEPRSKLAKTWGISDVAIGKLCVRKRLPVPPRGCWAKKAAGGRASIIPLTMRLPGQRDLVELGPANSFRRWNTPFKIDEEVSPPTYQESIEIVIDSALKQLGPFRLRRDLSTPHRGLRRLLDSEAKRAEKLIGQEWVFDKPRFQEPRFQRQLRILNSIFLALEPISTDCDVTDRSVWIQGIGHVHYLYTSVVVGSSRIRLQFLEPENPKNCADLARSIVTTLRIGEVGRNVDFADAAEVKIEQRLEEIVKTILQIAEKQMRSSDLAIYERKLVMRDQHLKEIEERKLREQEELLAAVQARINSIRKEIGDAAESLRRATNIRILVDLMSAHPDNLGAGEKNYRLWARMALAEADALDPMKQPISKVFAVWNSDLDLSVMQLNCS